MRPTNTSKQDPFIQLMTALPGGIERQEAAGQSELVHSESLPSDCNDKAALEAAGVKFGAPYPDDPLFCPVTLPEGWKKVGADHAMYSYLLDTKGRRRAEIFYKAAFYDRRADMRVRGRYSYSAYEEGSDGDHARCVAKDGNTVIQEFGEAASYDERRALAEKAETWLTEHFPDWKSASAYWD